MNSSQQKPILTLVIVFVATAVFAAEHGTKPDAQTLVTRVIHQFEQVGAEQTFSEINAGAEDFRIRDISVYVLDRLGVVVAHSGDPNRVGTSPLWRRAFPQEMLDDVLVQAGTDGFIENYSEIKDHPTDPGHAYIRAAGDYLFVSDYYE